VVDTLDVDLPGKDHLIVYSTQTTGVAHSVTNTFTRVVPRPPRGRSSSATMANISSRGRARGSSGSRSTWSRSPPWRSPWGISRTHASFSGTAPPRRSSSRRPRFPRAPAPTPTAPRVLRAPSGPGPRRSAPTRPMYSTQEGRTSSPPPTRRPARPSRCSRPRPLGPHDGPGHGARPVTRRLARAERRVDRALPREPVTAPSNGLGPRNRRAATAARRWPWARARRGRW
jgi:hypothetical protein